MWKDKFNSIDDQGPARSCKGIWQLTLVGRRGQAKWRVTKFRRFNNKSEQNIKFRVLQPSFWRRPTKSAHTHTVSREFGWPSSRSGFSRNRIKLIMQCAWEHFSVLDGRLKFSSLSWRRGGALGWKVFFRRYNVANVCVCVCVESFRSVNFSWLYPTLAEMNRALIWA